jgi:surfeit locus 1 family protein
MNLAKSLNNKTATKTTVAMASTTSNLYSTQNYSRPPINLKKVRTNNKQKQTSHEEEDSEGLGSGGKKAKTIGLAFLAIPIFTFGLAMWQIKRRQWKIDLINYMEERTRSKPVELPTDPAALQTLVKDHEYRPFKVRGHFLHSREILLTIRHDQKGRMNLPGGYVITPFVLSNRADNLTILVNRGYVPYTHYMPSKRPEAQVEGEVELIGLLRDDEITSTFTPINKPPEEWHFRNITEMALALGTAPIFIDTVDSTPIIKGGPLPGQTAINLRNEHMSYILTWFTLSGLTSFMWWRRFAHIFF